MAATDVTAKNGKYYANRVGALYEANFEFLKKREGTGDIASCVLYQSSPKVAFSQLPAHSSLVDSYMHGNNAGGGTSYVSAMKAIKSLVEATDSSYNCIALFMTGSNQQEDGATDVLKEIMASHGNRFILHSIVLGQVNASLLNNFAAIGKGTFSVVTTCFEIQGACATSAVGLLL